MSDSDRAAEFVPSKDRLIRIIEHAKAFLDACEPLKSDRASWAAKKEDDCRAHIAAEGLDGELGGRYGDADIRELRGWTYEVRRNLPELVVNFEKIVRDWGLRDWIGESSNGVPATNNRIDRTKRPPAGRLGGPVPFRWSPTLEGYASGMALAIELLFKVITAEHVVIQKPQSEVAADRLRDSNGEELSPIEPSVGELWSPNSPAPTDSENSSVLVIFPGRLSIDIATKTITLDGEDFLVLHAPTFSIYKLVAQSRGNLVLRSEFKKINGCNGRIDKILSDHLPKELRDTIRGQTGNGGYSVTLPKKPTEKSGAQPSVSHP